jgi:hypothetical protein
MLFRIVAVASALSVLSIGCSKAPTPVPAAITTAPEQPNELLLKSEPADAKTVIEARKALKDGDDVVVTGRIGGAVDPWVEGRAAFSIVDQTLIPCSERPGDSCTTPWDYCCDTDRLPQSLATIKFVDGQGKTLSTDARKLLGVKELQIVVVKGKAKRDDAGNLTVLATGLFAKPIAPAQ